MVINGRKLADEILMELKKEIQKLPRLTVGAVLVGKNSASESFLKQKAKVAEFLGVNFKIFRYKSTIKTEELIKEVLKISRNPIENNNTTSRRSSVNGIIVQLPLPKNIKTDLVLKAIDPKKDIDALSKNPRVLAPTTEAVKFIFQKYKIIPHPFKRVGDNNKNILIVGRGRLVGQPIFKWLVSQAPYRKVVIPRKIKIIDIKQKNQLPKLARGADIIISGVGKASLINGNIIKKGAVLIDFGFSKKNGKINGDFDFGSCAKKAKITTPVPGGMGPIMVAMLFKNLLKLNKPRH